MCSCNSPSWQYHQLPCCSCSLVWLSRVSAKLLLFSSLGEVMPVQLSQVFSVELRAQPVIWQCGCPLACACGGSSWRQHPLLFCSAVLLSSSWGTSALDSFAMRLQDWAYLQLSMALEKWCRSRQESRRRILSNPFFPLQKISPEITSVSCPGNNDFKADNSNKTSMFPGQFFH